MIRVERNQFAKTIAAIPLCLVLSSFSLLSEPEKIDVISLFIHHLFGTMSLDTHGTFLLVMENMLFLLLFQVSHNLVVILLCGFDAVFHSAIP